jgi:serine/threonine protein kinase
VGAGGFGVVYRGVLHAADVAVKLIDPNVAGALQAAKQFKAEVDALSRARHQNIVMLLGSCPSAHMLVFEYVDCGTLEDRMLWGRAKVQATGGLQPLLWHQRVSVARQMASGLDYLHGLGIVHMWVVPESPVGCSGKHNCELVYFGKHPHPGVLCCGFVVAFGCETRPHPGRLGTLASHYAFCCPCDLRYP